MDANGCERQCEQLYTECRSNDEEAPELVCPSDTVYTTSEDGQLGNCGVVGQMTIPHGSDNCGISQLSYNITLPDGSVDGVFDLSYVYNNPQLFGDETVLDYDFPVGVSIVTIIVTDASGNQTECSYEVEVLDDEAPAFVNCPADTITVGNNFSNCEGGVNWSVPIASDNCEVEVEQTVDRHPVRYWALASTRLNM